MAWIDSLFQRMVQNGASDLHMSSTCTPMFRLHGDMVPVEGCSVITPEQMTQILYEIAPESNRAEYERCRDTDFAYELAGAGRFRANLFCDHRGPGGVFRLIPSKILSAEQLGLPKSVLDLCRLSKGLVLVTGPTGSGKSTTLAAMVDHINQTRCDHILTIEDPIEFVHPNKRCLVNQREVKRHTESFKRALRAALREDPDIVLVGEMRDLETIEIAIETAETGHLVFGTLHTTTAATTVDRIIDQFPSERQAQIRTMLSSSLKGVVAQTLCKKKGGGRVAALEILIANSAIASNIREGKTHQIGSLMQMGAKSGMKLLNDALMDLVRTGQVDAAEAYMKCVAKDDFVRKCQGEGIALNVEGDEGSGSHGAPTTASTTSSASPQQTPSRAPTAPARSPSTSSSSPATSPTGGPGTPAPRGPLPQSTPQAPAARPTTPGVPAGADPFDAFKKQRGH